MKSTFVAPALTLLLAAPALVSAAPQFGPGTFTDGMGRMDSPEQKAMAAYSRGVKLKKKADETEDPKEKIKLYEKAKAELSKSLGYQQHYDGFIALGQVYLALGKRESALDACLHAQNLKPSDEPAKSCIEEARKPSEKTETERKAGGGGR
jgi:tetratricopeptide (TPR) repeat protein